MKRRPRFRLLLRALFIGWILSAVLLPATGCRDDQGIIDRHQRILDEEDD